MPGYSQYGKLCRLAVLTIIFLLQISCTRGQTAGYYLDDGGISGSKNNVKADLSGIPCGVFALEYERRLSRDFSLALSGGLLNKSIHFLSLFELVPFMDKEDKAGYALHASAPGLYLELKERIFQYRAFRGMYNDLCQGYYCYKEFSIAELGAEGGLDFLIGDRFLADLGISARLAVGALSKSMPVHFSEGDKFFPRFLIYVKFGYIY